MQELATEKWPGVIVGALSVTSVASSTRGGLISRDSEAKVFVILPTLLLLLYPFRWFQKFLNLFPVRWYILHTFVDSFQGCYKDGTEPGTRDCRWFSSIFLALRFLYFIIGSFTMGIMFYAFTTYIFATICILLISIQPFKEPLRHLSYTNTAFLFLLALWNVLVITKELTKARHGDVTIYLVSLGIIGIIPLVYISVIFLSWIYKNRRFGLHVWKNSYQLL